MAPNSALELHVFNSSTSSNYGSDSSSGSGLMTSALNDLSIVVVCCIFILLSRESDDGDIFWTNLHSLKRRPFLSSPVVS